MRYLNVYKKPSTKPSINLIDVYLNFLDCRAKMCTHFISNHELKLRDFMGPFWNYHKWNTQKCKWRAHKIPLYSIHHVSADTVLFLFNSPVVSKKRCHLDWRGTKNSPRDLGWNQQIFLGRLIPYKVLTRPE